MDGGSADVCQTLAAPAPAFKNPPGGKQLLVSDTYTLLGHSYNDRYLLPLPAWLGRQGGMNPL